MANTYITIPDAKEVKQEFAQIYKEHGLEGIATETGVVEANNLIDVKMITPTITQLPQVQTQIVQPRQGVRVITVPSLTSAQTPAKLQTAQQFVSPAASPIIVSTPCSGYRGAQVITQLDSPVWSGGKKRTNTFPDLEYSDSTKKRRMDKTGKGLRHFSMKVCEKVQKKGVTSYNEVADELVADFTDPHLSANGDQYDQKNIRRRVYDALNVLMAMNIISKEKKEIRWKGLPTNSVQECQKLEKERTEQIKRVEQKTQQLQELILQQIAFKNLVERNKSEEQIHGAPADSSAIQLPFIIVNTSKKTVIDCSISNDKYEYMFNFDNTFEIHDDIEVLKRMGMAFDLEKKQCTPANLQKALQMMPKSLEPYIKELGGQGTTDPLARCGTGSNNGSTSSSSTVKYGHLALSPLATPLSGQSTKKQSLLDLSHEQELAAAQHFLSRQSSIGSYSRDSQLDDIYSEGESDSERSSPVEILT